MASQLRKSSIDRLITWSFDRPLSALAQVALATIIILAVGAARVLFIPETLPWLLFIPATILISMITGWRTGIFAAVLSIMVGVVSLGSADNPIWVGRQHWVSAALVLIVMVGLVMLVIALRSALWQGRLLNAELSERERQAAEREAFLSSVLASSTDCIKVLDLDGNLTFMSEGGQRVMEVSDFNAIAGCPWPDFWQGRGNAQALAALDLARRGEAYSFTGRASTMAGTSKWWHVAVSPIPGADGSPARILSVSRDISDFRESEEERDQFVRLVENSTDFVGMAHTDGRIFYLNDAARRLVGLGDAENDELVIADFFPPDQNKIVQCEVLPTVTRGGNWEGELFFRHFRTGELIPVLYSVFPITGEDGALTGYGTVTRDFRAKKAAEEQLHLLNGELSHRLKNTLGVVQAIAIQTLGTADPEMLSAFSKRLNALSSAHDVLLKQSWSEAGLRDVVDGALVSFDQAARFHVAGPDLSIGPRATLALSLLLHELATNATKYGALSVSAGTVELSWSISADQTVTMRWAERGGPPAVEPKRRGFGSRIIRMGLTGSGGVDLRYGEEGLTAEMTAPLDQLQQA